MSNHLHTDLPPLTLSFMGANFVARELGYGAADEWGPFDAATNAAFEPLETYGARLDEILAIVASAGFEAMDMWLAHLNWRWATPEHIAIARDLLDRHGIRVVSLAGSFGETPSDLEAACRLANALEVDLLGGMGDVLRNHRSEAETVLREHGVRFAYENHPGAEPAGGARADRRRGGRARGGRRHRLVGHPGLRPRPGDPRPPGPPVLRPPQGRRGAGNAQHLHARRRAWPRSRRASTSCSSSATSARCRSSTSPTTAIRSTSASGCAS